ncbi:ATP-binding protein [Nonomuraea sp. NPDC052129]|uniref:ATP-binding protein n=1 Tax=Nonomuraea sp. NPDC052129 TaxID=3154651 RepID=UPI00342246AD
MPQTIAPAAVFVPKQCGSGAVQRELIDAMIDLHPGGLSWRRTFPGTADQIPHARHFTRYLLADAPCQDDAEQIVAELGANALQHTSSGRPGGTFIVEITRTTVTTTVAVYDCGWGGCPRFGMDCRTTAECGRGLALVTAIADQVGCEGDKEMGHRVWAKIHTNPCP